MKNITIGVLGGMGTYATIHLFRKYAEIFSAEKEWERPRIIIDNRCTMPSRVRAFQYKENVGQLIDEMADSMIHLVESGCNRVILACNTSHLFLPEIYIVYPHLREKVIHIISNCMEVIKQDGIKSVYLLGSESTIDSEIYQRILLEQGINCIVPNQDDYDLIRFCIEAVKQNHYSDKVKKIFLGLINRNNACILGCTELPILYEMYQSEVICENIYDPLLLVLKALKKEFEDE